MTGSEALVALKEYKRVRRKCWKNKKSYAMLAPNPESKHCYDYDIVVVCIVNYWYQYELNASHFLYDDWEVFE